MAEATDSQDVVKDGHFVVPVKILMALTVKADEDNLNDAVTDVITKMQESSDLRSKFYSWSKELAESVSEGSAILIPSVFLPVTDKEEANVAIDFVKKLNEQLEKEQKKQPDEK